MMLTNFELSSNLLSQLVCFIVLYIIVIITHLLTYNKTDNECDYQEYKKSNDVIPVTRQVIDVIQAY